MPVPDNTPDPGATAALKDVANSESGAGAGNEATSDYHGPNPFWSKDLFVGRHNELALLERKLREGRSTLLIGGRRAGKTTMIRRLSQDRIGRTLIRADASGWDLSSMETGLGALRGELEGLLPTTYGQASRDHVVRLLTDTSPVALVIDEADYLLLAPWGPMFYRLLRWLDDKHLGQSISILLAGGPVLELFSDPDDRGSPPLNTTDPSYISALDRDAILELASLAGRADDCHEILALCGGHAWLTTTLLAEMWEGASLEDAADVLFDKTVAMYEVWERQLGEQGRALLRRLPEGGVSWSEFTKPPWASYRAARKIGLSIGAIRRDDGRLCPGPKVFIDWLTSGGSGELTWDIAISYATEDLALAREVYEQLRAEFRVFFAPQEAAGLWGADLTRALPNTYGVQSKHVLVLSTQHYVSKYWTKTEYESAAAHAPDRIVLLDCGALPDGLSKGLVYRRGSPDELADLANAFRTKLARRSKVLGNDHPDILTPAKIKAEDRGHHKGQRAKQELDQHPLAQDLPLPREMPSKAQSLRSRIEILLSDKPPDRDGQPASRPPQSRAITLGQIEPQPANEKETAPEATLIGATLVTIHGYWSSPATWDRLNEVWCADEELRGLRIHPFGYPSPKKPRLPFSGTRVPDYDDIAQTLASEYVTALAGASDVVVVTHSQGGLILQRFLAWMVNEGRARELDRVRSVVTLACPNGGSEYLKSVRHALGYSRHPQAGSLNVLNRQVADTQRIVLQRIVHTATLDDHHCRIPFHVYAGASDNIVKAVSAQAAFPGASTIAGNHSTILDPTSPGNRTAETVKRHLLGDIAAPREHPRAVTRQAIDGGQEPSSDKPTGSAKYVVNVHGVHGLQIGDDNVQQNVSSDD